MREETHLYVGLVLPQVCKIKQMKNNRLQQETLVPQQEKASWKNREPRMRLHNHIISCEAVFSKELKMRLQRLHGGFNSQVLGFVKQVGQIPA